jgi:dolichol-phosphate mannosyltransferase
VRISVVTPTYNEAENLPELVSALFTLSLPELSIWIVDDNSPDGTGTVAERLADAHPGKVLVLHRPGKLGLGTAYIEGFGAVLQSGADAIIQMDADFSHPPELIPRLIETLQVCDVAMGSRYVPGGGVDQRWPLWRKGLSMFGNVYARLVLGLSVRDATGGYRAWKRETLLGMPLEQVRSNGYAFQVEMAYLAQKLGFKFKEVPFYFEDRRWGQSKMSFGIQKEAALRCWQMRREYAGLKPKDH